MVDKQWEGVLGASGVGYAVYCNHQWIKGWRTQNDEQSERTGMNGEYENNGSTICYRCGEKHRGSGYVSFHHYSLSNNHPNTDARDPLYYIEHW
jgi:hypothetical protein